MRRLALLFAFFTAASAEEVQIAPYVDPAQLDCPWPKSSQYLQPWRGYMETRSGRDFLNGLGVNLHIPDGCEELAIRLLAETGFRAARIEVGFGESNWDETALNNEAKYKRRFALLAKHGIRPTILINAHQGAPCPMKTFKRRLVADAPKGATTVQLNDVSDLTLERSGLSGLSEYWAAEALITAIDPTTNSVTLSKPLPKDLKAGDIALATLKYPPLAPVGMPDFDSTAAGWVGHALRVCRLARAAGVENFDVEIWNELTFGTRYLDANNYWDKAAPHYQAPQPDFLNPGGRCWELARRTVDAVKAEFPQARVIWGFSNTSFHHTAIPRLPPRMDGQSYHPYGTGTKKIEGIPLRKDQPPLEGFVPRYEIRMPEGIMHTFIQTECLIRHLNPLERLSKRPPNTPRFFHYMTEHGVLAQECGITDETGAWQLKALCASRSFLLWLNKGVDVLHYYDAYEKDPKSFGILPADLPSLPADASFEKVATQPMRVIREISRAFAGSMRMEKTSPIQVEVSSIDPQRNIFDGDVQHPPLTFRDVFTVLPFQVDEQHHIIAFYVMTRDATKPIAPDRYRLRIRGAKGSRVECLDPHDGKSVKVEVAAGGTGSLEVIVPAVEHPRLLKIIP
jgi:hypothetical protein